MLFFTNAKINIGLNIIEKRSDGFHNLETVFYPIQIRDAIEFVETTGKETSIQTSGIELDIPYRQNICYAAYKLMAKHYDLPKLQIHLHKFVPAGAGLGGGSANAAGFIKALNEAFNLGISVRRMEELAVELGSDCPFFIRNKAVFASGRGEVFERIDLDLSKYYVYIVKPNILVNTGMAFAGITPHKPHNSIKSLINKPIEEWKDIIFNDFETNIFAKYSQLAQIKADFYEMGALYASMSGSGSALYGIFDEKPEPMPNYSDFFNWIGKLSN